MRNLLTWMRAGVTAAAVSFGLVALIVVAVIAGRPGQSLANVMHGVVETGLIVAVIVLVGALVIYVPLQWSAERWQWRSPLWTLAAGTFLGLAGFVAHYLLLRDPREDAPTLMAYAAWLWRVPGELTGAVPFIAAGIILAWLALHGRRLKIT